MGWKLRENMSFCRVDGRLIFLDVQNDCYFQLPERLESAFISHIEGSNDDKIDVIKLVERGILLQTAEPTNLLNVPVTQPPNRSAIEDASHVGKLPLRTLLEVAAIVSSTRRQLRRSGLKEVLDKISAYRRDHLRHFPSNDDSSAMRRLLDTSVLFLHARRYVPIDTTCLLDSISMLKFLAKRGFQTNVVFAVTGNPFSAHCWVQSGDIVLNDTVGSANAHTPLWII